jgi:hypothetical protein
MAALAPAVYAVVAPGSAWSQGSEVGEAMSHMVRMWNEYNRMRQWGQLGDRPPIAPASPRQAKDLGGIWRSLTGEAILIRGDRFRILGLDGSRHDGVFMLYRDRMIAYLPATDTTRKYRFERQGPRLMLQDESGQQLHFLRQMPGTPPSPPW